MKERRAASSTTKLYITTGEGGRPVFSRSEVERLRRCLIIKIISFCQVNSSYRLGTTSSSR